MKKFLLLQLLISSSLILSAEEEEQRYLEKDGKIYKINSSSLHLTPSDEDQKISKSIEEMDSPSELAESQDSDKKDKSKCECDMTISMGTLTPLGNGADNYDPGTSLSFKFPTKHNFNLFGKDFNVSAEVNLSNLAGINSNDDNNIKAGIANFHTEFDLPVDFTFGLGIADLDQSGGIAGTVVLDFSYNLPVLDNDLSLGFRYQKFVDVSKEDPYLDFGLLDVYSLNLNYSKVLKF